MIKNTSSEFDMIILTEKFKNRKSESSLGKPVVQQFSIPLLWKAAPSPHFANGDLCIMSIPVTQIDRFLTSWKREPQWSISYWRGPLRIGPGCEGLQEKCLGDKR